MTPIPATSSLPPRAYPAASLLERPPVRWRRWGAGSRLLARVAAARGHAAALAGAALLLLACEASNGPLFDEEVTLDPLSPPGLGQGGTGESVITPVQSPSDNGAVGGSGGGGASVTPPLVVVGGGGGPRPIDAPDAGAGPMGNAGTGGSAGSGGTVTGPPPPSDASCGEQCVRNGGRCGEGTCFFDCAARGACDTRQLLCPPDRPCDVTCGERSCTDNVVCPVGSTCAIRCAGEEACAKEIICEGQCDVECTGERSCRGGIGGAAVLLQLECSGRESCGSTVQCEGRDCQVSCSGRDSCERVRIFAAQNTLVCSGRDSCGTDITCMGNRCTAECADDACDNGVDCQALQCELGELANEGRDD
jgi:hypothetical protein